MNKEFIPYELRTALVELGYNYDAVCYHRADMKGQPIISEETAVRIHGSTDCLNHPAILYQQAFRWFREKHGLHANINSVGDSTQYGFIPNGKYSGTIDDVTIGKEMIATDTVCLIPIGDTYEEAEQACLDKLIKLVKEKQ